MMVNHKHGIVVRSNLLHSSLAGVGIIVPCDLQMANKKKISFDWSVMMIGSHGGI
jgi:hypothetical protein